MDILRELYLEALVHPAVTQGEGVGDGAPKELGGDVWLGVGLVLRLRVLGGCRLELAVGGQVARVIVVRMLDLGRVGVWDDNKVVVTEKTWVI